MADMSREAVRKIENGDSQRPTKLPAIAEALGVRIELLTGDEVPASPSEGNPFTDPIERQLWELDALPESERRNFIAIYRARRDMEREEGVTETGS